MAIKKYTLLMVTDIETKVVEPLSCFKSDDDIKAVLHPLATPLLWDLVHPFYKHFCAQIFERQVEIRHARLHLGYHRLYLAKMTAQFHCADHQYQVSMDIELLVKHAKCPPLYHFVWNPISKIGSFYNSFIELHHCRSHHLNGHGFLYLPRHILAIKSFMHCCPSFLLFVVCVNMKQSIIRLTCLLFLYLPLLSQLT